jgi:hypothetical protein
LSDKNTAIVRELKGIGHFENVRFVISATPKHKSSRHLDARESARGFFESQWERYFADGIPSNADFAGTLPFKATARESQSTAGSRRNL